MGVMGRGWRVPTEATREPPRAPHLPTAGLNGVGPDAATLRPREVLSRQRPAGFLPAHAQETQGACRLPSLSGVWDPQPHMQPLGLGFPHW